MTTFATLNDQRVVQAHLHVPGFGNWQADVALDDQAAAPLSGRVTLVIGDLTLSGTIVAAASGTFVQRGWYRIVGGAGAWSTILSPKGYHNDAGIKASLVIGDAAREAGETLGSFADTTLEGVDFVRQSGPASRIFPAALGGGVGWWVDYAGTTQVGPRVASTPAPGAVYDLLEYHPSTRIAVFATETPSVLAIGMTITNDRLVAPVTIREIDLTLSAKGLRISAWVDEAGTTGPFDARILRALRALVRETVPNYDYLAPSRYRVVSMTEGRANLQAVRPTRGMPDTTLVRLAPGMAGETAKLTPGATVLVQFVEGDPSMPVITGYATPDDAAFAPVEWSVAATGKATISAPDVAIGAGAAASATRGTPVGRLGDLVASGGPTMVPLPIAIVLTAPLPVTGAAVPSGTPIIGAFTFPVGPLMGSVTTGSPEVRAT